jgi:hypothetical protein
LKVSDDGDIIFTIIEEFYIIIDISVVSDVAEVIGSGEKRVPSCLIELLDIFCAGVEQTVF